MTDVFISFADDEKRVALALKKILDQKIGDLTVFVSADYWQMSGGERWLDRIERELRSAKVVVLLMSARSVTRPWINFEAGAAWLNRSLLILVCFGGLSVRALPKPYGDFQAIQLDDPKQLYPLVRSVSAGVGQRVPPLPFGNDAPVIRELHDALEGSLDNTVPQSAVEPTRLSELAREFLTEAAKSATGEIFRQDMDLILVIQVNSTSYEAKLDEPRKRAALDGALSELETAGLITSVDYRRTVCRITTDGYVHADQI